MRRRVEQCGGLVGLPVPRVALRHRRHRARRARDTRARASGAGGHGESLAQARLRVRRVGHRAFDPTERSGALDKDRVEGKVKETEGELQQKWGKAKDKARDTWEDVTDKAEDLGDEAEDRWDARDEEREPAESGAR